MLKNNKLLIDENCPMCTSYGKYFTKWKWIDQNTLLPYQEADDCIMAQIDAQRAKSEIAFFNPKTGYTYYGIDAMIQIVSQRKAWRYKLLTLPVIYNILRILYFFISYNRKVILPTRANPQKRDCTPPKHRVYQWAYILMVAILTGIMLNQFTHNITNLIGLPSNHYLFEYMLAFGQIGWQGIVIQFIAKEKTLVYLGNMSSVSLMGAILLLPIIIIQSFLSIPEFGLIIYFFIVVSIMFFDHIRRCKLIGLPIYMTISWVSFRLMALIFLLLGMS